MESTENHHGTSKLLAMLLGMATCCLAIRPAEALTGLAVTTGRSLARYTNCRRVSAPLTLPIRFLSDTRWDATLGSVVSSGSYSASSTRRGTVVSFTLDDASREALRTEMQRRISAACGGRAVALPSVTVRMFRGRVSRNQGSLSVSLTVGLAGADGRGAFRYKGRGRLGPLPTTTTSTTIPTSSINLNGLWTGTVDVGSAPGNSSPACVTIDQSQNAISGTIHQFGGTATLLATLSGSQLLGLTIEGFFVEADCAATGSGTVNGDTITINVTPEAPCNSNLLLTYTFTRGGACP